MSELSTLEQMSQGPDLTQQHAAEAVQLVERQQIIDHLNSVAAARGVELTPDRQESLAAKAAKYSERKVGDEPARASFSQDGLIIGKPFENTNSGRVTSRVDFLPKTKGDRHGSTLPQRGESTLVGLAGLRALQDYTLLADGGFLQPPEELLGGTNETMARVANRVGFAPVEGAQHVISAPFDVVRERVFSPDVMRMGDVLERRAQQLVARVGTLALQ